MLEGDSISKTIADVSVITGNNPLFSQNRIIIFGKNTAKNKISEVLDFFSREYTLRINVPVVVADCSAYEILKTDTEVNETGAKTLTQIIETGIENSQCVESEVYKIINLFGEKGTSACIPLISVKKNTVNDKNTVYLKGTAVYNGKNLCMYLNCDETVILNVLMNKAQSGTFNFKSENNTVCVEIVNMKTKTDFDYSADKINFNSHIKCRVDVLEYGDGDNDSIDEKGVENIEKQTENHIKEKCNGLFDKLKKKNCDCLRYLRLIGVKNVKLYNYIEEENFDYMENSFINVTVNAGVRRIGQNTVEKKVN